MRESSSTIRKNGDPWGVPLNKDVISALTEIEPDPIQRVRRIFKRRDGQVWVRFEPV
jgi:hypothetical protein